MNACWFFFFAFFQSRYNIINKRMEKFDKRTEKKSNIASLKRSFFSSFFFCFLSSLSSSSSFWSPTMMMIIISLYRYYSSVRIWWCVQKQWWTGNAFFSPFFLVSRPFIFIHHSFSCLFFSIALKKMFEIKVKRKRKPLTFFVKRWWTNKMNVPWPNDNGILYEIATTTTTDWPWSKITTATTITDFFLNNNNNL